MSPARSSGGQDASGHCATAGGRRSSSPCCQRSSRRAPYSRHSHTRALEQAVVATLLDEAPSPIPASGCPPRARRTRSSRNIPASSPNASRRDIRRDRPGHRQSRSRGAPDAAGGRAGRTPAVARDRMCNSRSPGPVPHAAGRSSPADQAVGYAQHLGAEFDVSARPGRPGPARWRRPLTTTVRVVGVYRPRAATIPYWLWRPAHRRRPRGLGFDVMLTASRGR